jgi:UDP-N-acetylmuramyl pentapeptide phosphotransferase/UDP-N-acetylglucosamine-1-phosphate transferase
MPSMRLVPLPAYGVLTTASFVLSVLLCALVRTLARRLRLVDVPNERSLHKVPVPRLGGVAIVVSVWIVLALAGLLVAAFYQADVLTWLAGASTIAVLGFADDLRPIPPLPRLFVQCAAAAVTLGLVIRSGNLNVVAGWSVHLPRGPALMLSLVFVVATTNIYNFMDGMDGLAATQAIAVGLALAVCTWSAGQYDLALIGLTIAAASAGFLVYNAPPATLFLGDAGSTFLGFGFGVLAFVAATRPAPVPLGVVPTALAPFLCDGTFTILRRLLRGERIWQAHRTHLYQRAVATGLTHRDVLVAYAVWCALAGAGSILVARSESFVAPAAVVVAALALPGIWGWVVRRERAAQCASQ